jgi:5-dehydro-4-deoxyglucarate dehydratase
LELSFGNGPLFFPVTPFDDADQVASDVLEAHVASGVAHGAGAVFAAGGTGEFHALSSTEFETVVRISVAATADRVPVFAGAGGNITAAIECATIAKKCGARGLLVMPPYLVSSPQEGLIRYIRQISEATDLPLIVYNRDNAIFQPSTVVALTRIKNVVGFKDGQGDIEQLRGILSALHTADTAETREFSFFNGLPTAETTMMAYRGLGISLYSSAAYAFAPEMSLAFYQALRDNDDKLRDALLDGFFEPLAALRERTPGYAVALVKAGLRLRGTAVGRVRAPLTDVSDDDLLALEGLVDKGLRMVDDNVAMTPQPQTAP